MIPGLHYKTGEYRMEFTPHTGCKNFNCQKDFEHRELNQKEEKPMEKRREEPSDLVALADLVHAPRECSEGSEEYGDGAWALVRDAASEPDRCETARRWTVLENRHVLHAHHAWLVPYIGLRHLFPISSLPRLVVWNTETVITINNGFHARELALSLFYLFQCVKRDSDFTFGSDLKWIVLQSNPFCWTLSQPTTYNRSSSAIWTASIRTSIISICTLVYFIILILIFSFSF